MLSYTNNQGPWVMLVMLVMFLQGAARFGASWLACAAAAKISATACGGNLDLLSSKPEFLWFFRWDKSESSTFRRYFWINSLLVDFGWRNKSGDFFFTWGSKPLPNICKCKVSCLEFPEHMNLPPKPPQGTSKDHYFRWSNKNGWTVEAAWFYEFWNKPD